MSEHTSTPRYIHGYLSEEQERLREQAAVIEGPIYDALDLSGVQRLLEIGSGVGAQTEILLRRFPQLHITGLEYEPSQIAKANLNREAFGMPATQVEFVQGDAHAIPLAGGFDGAFICWVLEHVHTPLQVLKETGKQLLPGGKVWVTEVFNATFYTYPYQPAVMHYWQVYNTFQREIGGDPDVGAKLGSLLEKANFREIKLRDDGFHLDARMPEKRAEVLRYWKNLMRSGAPVLLATGRIVEAELEKMLSEMDALLANPEAVFYYRFVQAEAVR